MASPTTDIEERTSKFAAVLKSGSAPAAPPRPKRRRFPRWVTVSVVVLALLGLGVAATVKSDLLMPATSGRQILTEKVKRADLIVSVTEDGTVESSHNV